MKSSTNIVNQQLIPTKIDEKEIRKGRKLGSGLTSKVYYGIWYGENQSQIVAIKEYKIGKDDNNRWLKQFEVENSILNLLTSTNENEYIIKYHGYFESRIYHSLVIEHMDTNLFDYLKYNSMLNKFLPLQDILMYANKIAHGLECLHRNNIIYRDLKPENVLISYKDEKLKLGDFGFSIFKQDLPGQKDLCGSLFYVAPELVLNRKKNNDIPFSEKSDMYAYAIVLYFISELKSPYLNLSHQQVIKLLLKNKRPELVKSPPFVSNLINRCWDKKADKRPTAKDVIVEIENENKIKM